MNTRKWEDFSCVSRINIIKMTILSKAISRFSTIPLSALILFFTGIKNVLNFLWSHRRLQISEMILAKYSMLVELASQISRHITKW